MFVKDISHDKKKKNSLSVLQHEPAVFKFIYFGRSFGKHPFSQYEHVGLGEMERQSGGKKMSFKFYVD